MVSITYREAIKNLNKLQSNLATINAIKKSRNAMNFISIPEMKSYLAKSGLTIEEINHKLSVIHIAGTKGKGSTCAFIQSILNKKGLRTGMYTSPHLVHVRERICLNGVPLSESKFAYYFQRLWERLNEHNEPMPTYFRFLTLLACHVFVEEKVDVAIIETGIGGRFDCTNVFEKPFVCGITSLGYDHLSLLGNTLADIAYHKSGIIKKDVPIFTCFQPQEAMRVIEEESQKMSAKLTVVEPIERNLVLGIPGDHQRINAALAVAICQEFLGQKSELLSNDVIINGLKEARISGRCDTIVKGNTSYYIDGAHTPESIEKMLEWFDQQINPNYDKVCLIFNCTGDRSPNPLLRMLADFHINRNNLIEQVIFCPNIVHTNAEDSIEVKLSGKEMKQPQTNAEIWKSFAAGNQKLILCESVNEAVKIAQNYDKVLITGSLHLAGGVYSILQ